MIATGDKTGFVLTAPHLHAELRLSEKELLKDPVPNTNGEYDFRSEFKDDAKPIDPDAVKRSQN